MGLRKLKTNLCTLKFEKSVCFWEGEKRESKKERN